MENNTQMTKREAIEIGIEALENILYYASEGIIWGGDGTEETEREIENDIKAYEKAIEVLSKEE